MTKDLTSLIERLGAFEDRLGISFEGLYASIDDRRDWHIIRVNGEVHPLEGVELVQDMEVVVTLHDSAGRVIDMDDQRIRADEFFGFEAFSTIFSDVTYTEVTKIRVYPKAS